MPDPGMRKLVDPILGAPSPFGLLGNCVDVITVTDPHELNGTEFLAAACNAAGTWQDCPPEDNPNPAAKTFHRPGICSFAPITVYAGVVCSTFGLTFEDGQKRAMDQLMLGEQRALESWFMTDVLCDMAQGNDFTPAEGAVSVVQGVSILENWLASVYGGAGVIHAPAGAGAFFSSNTLVDFASEERCPSTLMGNGIVFGSGYTVNVGGVDCTQAVAGEGWLYITGPVRVRRDTPYLVTRTEGQQIDKVKNDRYALAETTFVVEVACCEAAAVRVKLC